MATKDQGRGNEQFIMASIVLMLIAIVYLEVR